jgi:hypothetical protein
MIVPQQEIHAALDMNLATLRDGFFDLLAALVLMLTALFSCLHAVVRMLFALLGLFMWALALLITFLYWLRAWAISRSASSLHGGSVYGSGKRSSPTS